MPRPNIQKINPKCEAVKTDETAKLYLYGNITRNSWWDEEAITSSSVKEQLANLSDVKKLEVHINSGGGDVFESIAILNLLKQHPASIDIYIDGLAASGASVIAMAGENIIMPKTAMMMIHKAWTFAMGNADELRKTAEDMDKMDSAVLEAYKEKFIGDEEDLKTLVKNETWLTAQECFELGLCSELFEEEKPEEDIKTADEIKNSILEKMRLNAQARKVDKTNNILNKFKREEI